MNKLVIFNYKNNNKQLSFSNFKKTDVKKRFMNCLKNNELDNSLYWGVELDLSGEQEYIWNQILYFYCDYVNIYNSSFILYYFKRYESFIHYSKNIYKEKYDYRNSLKMRNHLCELISTIVCSNYNTIQKLPKISNNDFDFNNHILLCKEINEINNIILINDPKDIIVPCNEILYILSNNHNSSDYKKKCLFWINWLFTWDKQFNNNLVFRKIDNIDSKYYHNIHWIIWEIIFYSIKKKRNKNLNNKIQCYFYFFKHNYKKQIQKNKLIVCAIMLILENNKYNDMTFFQNYDKILKSNMNINYIYNLVYQNKLKYENKIN